MDGASFIERACLTRRPALPRSSETGLGVAANPELGDLGRELRHAGSLRRAGCRKTHVIIDIRQQQIGMFDGNRRFETPIASPDTKLSGERIGALGIANLRPKFGRSRSATTL